MTEYNPADHNVEDVKTHVEENPKDVKAILEAEQNGENRVTLVEHLQKLADEQPEVPVAAEAQAVTVEPSPTPTQTVGGREYTVDADRGYRETGKKDYTTPVR